MTAMKEPLKTVLIPVYVANRTVEHMESETVMEKAMKFKQYLYSRPTRPLTIHESLVKDIKKVLFFWRRK